jgi:SAM-dependent methyltransferase
VMLLASQTFTKRNCPSCSSGRSDLLFEVCPREFIGAHYGPEAEGRYGISALHKFNIVRCQDCEFLYTSLVPTPAFTALLYDTPNEQDHADPGALRPSWVAQQFRLATWLLDAIATDFGDVRPNLLDYGCGFGALVRALNGPTAQCVGLETSGFMRSYLSSQGLPVVASLSEVQARQHGVFLSDVLEHLPEPRKTLREVHSLLVPNGYVCVNVPDFSERRVNSIGREMKFGGQPPKDLNPWEHLNYFSPKTLRRMLRDEGFTPIERPINLRIQANRGLAKASSGIRGILRLLLYMAGREYASTYVLGRAIA